MKIIGGCTYIEKGPNKGMYIKNDDISAIIPQFKRSLSSIGRRLMRRHANVAVRSIG